FRLLFAKMLLIETYDPKIFVKDLLNKFFSANQQKNPLVDSGCGGVGVWGLSRSQALPGNDLSRRRSLLV
ncbi:MAG: hypothetical protein DSM106950_39110, partial [Stigonema ocellatum SAG 48.90 = DSM 106950]|nr:hypothetical protein [Stigonema ocellatum SAG 48.90 = DSM 106950]